MKKIPPSYQHWWLDDPYRKFTRAGLSQDTAKAALIYEGIRRRPEIAKAVADNAPDPAWQAITRLAFALLPLNWAQLQAEHQKALLDAMYDHTFIPPLGYSCSPKDNTEAKQKAAVKLLDPPDPSDILACGQWVSELLKLRDNGFVLAAIDRKSNESTRHAADAIEAIPRRFRSADIQREITYDNAASDFEHATRLLEAECATTGKTESITTARVKVQVRGKYLRGESLVEEKVFVFETIAEEITHWDDERIPSDFISRIRL